MHSNLSMPEIGFDVSVRKTVCTDSGSWGKKLSRVESGVPDIYVAFRFDTKLII